MADTKVLIVEDEMLIAMAIEDDLRDLGYTVVGIADTAAQAVEAAVATRPDIVLMDVRLHGEDDGVDAATRIRARGLQPRIIFVTGSREPRTLARIERTGPDGLLIKPVSGQAIHDAIRGATGNRRPGG